MYKTFSQLKEELKEKYEKYMYISNIELLNKIDNAKEELNDLVEELSWVENTDVELKNAKIIVKLNKIIKKLGENYE